MVGSKPISRRRMLNFIEAAAGAHAGDVARLFTKAGLRLFNKRVTQSVLSKLRRMVQDGTLEEFKPQWFRRSPHADRDGNHLPREVLAVPADGLAVR